MKIADFYALLFSRADAAVCHVPKVPLQVLATRVTWRTEWQSCHNENIRIFPRFSRCFDRSCVRRHIVALPPPVLKPRNDRPVRLPSVIQADAAAPEHAGLRHRAGGGGRPRGAALRLEERSAALAWGERRIVTSGEL